MQQVAQDVKALAVLAQELVELVSLELVLPLEGENYKDIRRGNYYIGGKQLEDSENVDQDQIALLHVIDQVVRLAD